MFTEAGNSKIKVKNKFILQIKTNFIQDLNGRRKSIPLCTLHYVFNLFKTTWICILALFLSFYIFCIVVLFFAVEDTQVQYINI